MFMGSSQKAYNNWLEKGAEYAQKYAEHMQGIGNPNSGRPMSKKALEMRTILGYLYNNLDGLIEDSKLEDTRSTSIGTFTTFGFPMIRAIIPNLAAINLISVQPLTGPTGFLFHLTYNYGTTKGKVTKGNVAFQDLPNLGTAYGSANGYNGWENYTAEFVDGEKLKSVVPGISPAANALASDIGTPFFANLAFTPVRTSTVVIKAVVTSVSSGSVFPTVILAKAGDGSTSYPATNFYGVDGSGNLTGTPLGSIDQGSGAISLTVPSSTAFGNSYVTGYNVVATYNYNSEGSKNLPEFELLVTQDPVTTVERKMRARWSVEAQANLKSQYQLNAGVELAMGIANEIRYEIDTEISQTILTAAYVASTTELPIFSVSTVPTNVSFELYKEQFMYTLEQASSLIEQRSAKGTGTWIICGRNLKSFIRTLNHFVGVPFLQGRGIRKIGTLKGMYDVYYDPSYADNTWVMGYKGSSFIDTGIVYAPYIAFYATPEIIQDDMMYRRAMMTQYGLRVVNNTYYVRSTVS
jgi:hypothetical protein